MEQVSKVEVEELETVIAPAGGMFIGGPLIGVVVGGMISLT
ncbi:hypothetical protein [Saccharibacillus kuerlensis]|uniref:Class IIb bacteriocin, lactobin A/cerein 7B family n=1 Tax=Saccharibacillus kuerlensis TaxID=459527 RepID=A0ABQ2L245_9BACL|nr:hypothetical protein [Saccharibacillus kuerlensis]GGO00041.1 hypothetical protein GCM10010969_20820 [Saccharibacillus kuerlensis]